MTNTTSSAAEYAVHPWERLALGKAPFRVVGFDVRKHQPCPEAPAQPGATCDACGTGIMNVYTIASADGRRFVVGCDCVAKTYDRVLIADVKARQAEARALARETRRLAREAGYASARAQRAAEFLAARPELVTALACSNEIVRDIAAKLHRYGSISPAQEALVMRLYFQSVDGCVQGPAEPPAVDAPDTDKRIEIVGTILGTKVQDSLYGSTLKMLVQVRTPFGAWKAWSTVPAGLSRPESGEWRGMAIRVKARVEVSRDDKSFAFLNRPTVCKGQNK